MTSFEMTPPPPLRAMPLPDGTFRRPGCPELSLNLAVVIWVDMLYDSQYLLRQMDLLLLRGYE